MSKSADLSIPLNEALWRFAPMRLLKEYYSSINPNHTHETQGVSNKNAEYSLGDIIGNFGAIRENLELVVEIQDALLSRLSSGELEARGVQISPKLGSRREPIPNFVFENEPHVDWRINAIENVGRRYEAIEVFRPNIRTTHPSSAGLQGRPSKSDEIHKAIEGLSRSGVDLNSLNREKAIHEVREYARREMGKDTTYGYSKSVIQRCLVRSLGKRI